MRKFTMPKLYANQWTSLWENKTIVEKMQRDGEINSLMTGGSIVHVNIDSEVTSSQAKSLIKKAIKEKMAHFALNAVYLECHDCGHVHKGNLDACPKCQSEKINKLTRVIGYFSSVAGWNKTRRTHDFPNRKFMTGEEIKQELGK